jgi:phosphoglycerate dehydrogenase-like enzyme
MSSTSLPIIVITTPMGDQTSQAQRKEQLQQHFPQFAFEIRPLSTFADISAEIWQRTEILITLGSGIPRKEQAPNLRWVHLYSAGADNVINNPLFEDPSIALTTSSGVHSIIIAEYVLAATLSWYHRFSLQQRWQQEKKWGASAIRQKENSLDELRGKTIGIVGYGSIGREIARQAQAFGMQIVASQQSSDHRDHGFLFPGIGDPEGTIPEHFYTSEQLHQLLQISDVVVAALPLTTQTRNLFDAAAFEAMKADALFINIARGEVCDEQALIHALQDRSIAGATLDVFQHEPLERESPLWELPNVFITPHISGLTPHYEERVYTIFEANLQRYQEGKSLYNRVDKKREY